MAGTKRLRSATKGTASTSDPDPSLMLQLFDHVKEIAVSSERCIAVLQGFCDSKCSLEPPKRSSQVPSTDCNSILIATHILKRLLHSSSTSFSLIAALGNLISKVLVSDGQKLEKASHVTSSRPILAYAFLTATIASLYCLEQYEAGKKVSASAIEACISTLHRMIFLKPHGDEGDDLDMNLNLDKRDATMELSSAEDKCISLLLLQDTEVGKEEGKASPGKRKTRRKSNPSSSSLSDTDDWFKALEELKASDSLYSQRLDARIAIKRWASVALVWECQGQLLLLQVSHKLAKQTQFASCSSRSEWMNDLVQIVSESGLHCGVRPPTGHIDHLCKIIHPSAAKSSSKSTSKRKSKPLRADIRDWTAVAIYDLLDVHRACLKNITSASSTSSMVVNDAKQEASSVYTAPELSSNLVNLCSAASNSAFTTDQGMRASWAKSLVDLFTACSLRLAVDPELPLDCSLTDVAVSQLATVLENAISLESIPMDEDMTVEEVHDLLQALAEPNIKKIDTDYTSPERSCTYAGLNESIPLDKPSEDSSLAIAIRAIWTAATDNGSQDATPAGQLVATLASIVERVYDTRESIEGDGNDNVEFVEENASKSKKRGARSSGRVSKRRKTKQQLATKPMDGIWRRISRPRVEVATEALKALKFCLLNQSIPTSHLRQSIRKSLGLEHYEKLLDLGPLLDRILVRTQEPVKMDIDGTFAFSKAEQELWAAHMEMCQYLGRGRSYDSGFMVHPILGTNSQRKSLYQGIAKDKSIGWSLSLPAAHQTLLIANLTSERKATTRSFTVPELYITKEYVKSIHRTMQTVQTLSKRELDDDHIYVETNLQLSYNDARVFVLAFCRLLKDDQLAILRDLVTQTQKDIKSILSNSTRRSLLSGNTEASGFVARVLVVCGCLLDVATIGSRLEKLIFANNGGQAKVSFPSFVSTMEWYTSDRCFMSIFDWESPSLPDSSLPQRSLSGLDSSVVDTMQMALEHAFELGFESARQDKCHLLFSSWNMMDKVNSITDYVVQRQGLRTTAFPSLQASLEGSLASRYLEIREDMTNLHSESNNDDSFRFNASRLRTSLRTMLTRANALVEMILANHVPEDELMSQSTPLLVFGLLEGLSTYISAAIALHTKPGNDYFSVSVDNAGTRNTRNRGDSSESEQVASDADSIESDGDRDIDARSETLDQLRRCCYTFGAAPIHPDWLDVSCSLRNGIRHEDATGAALDALRGLTRLAMTAYLQYRKHSSTAMQEHFGGTSWVDDDRVSLCIRLCNWANNESSKDKSHRDDVDWKDTLAVLFGVPQEVTEVLLGNLSVKNLEEARAAWCPNCTQQEDDKLQDRWLSEDGTWDAPTAELRACGEWGLLLAQSLTTSCLDVQYGSPYHTTSGAGRFAGHSGHEDMVAAQLWRNVMATAISSLMPAAALLRVGLGKTGRKPHPFCFQAKKNTAEEMAPIELAEELPRGVTTSSSQKAAVLDAISLLSHLSVQVDQELATQCQAVASHLLIESKSFADVVAVQSMVSAVGDLQSAQALQGTEGKENGRLKSISLVTELLCCAILESSRLSGRPDGPRSLESESNCRLMALLGASQKGFHVDTIVQKNIEPLQAFVQSKQLEPIDAVHNPKADLKSIVIQELVRILCRDRYPANDTSRSYVGTLLSTAASLDFFPSRSSSSLKIVPTLISSFNKVNKQKMTSLVIKDLCCLTKNRVVEPDSSSLSFRKSIANILCFLLLSSNDGIGFKNSKLVFDKLDGAIEAWSSLGYDDRAPVIEVLLLYACRFNGLQDVGSKLVRQAVSHIDESSELSVSSSEMKALSKLFGYVRRLRESLAEENINKVQSGRSTQPSKETSLREIPEIGKDLKLPLACSYVQESGFRTQHWYNCYTCGLVWDKGCCTLCALTCHKGHDVSYSRCSSFFCDCGAENNNPGEQTRVACKCVAPFTRDQTIEFLKDDWLSYETLDRRPPKAKEGSLLKTAEYYMSPCTLAIVQAAFREKGLVALKTLTSAALEATWHNDLFRILQSQFRNWQQTRSFESRLSIFEQEPTGHLETKSMIRSSHATLRGSLRTRRSRPLSLQHLSLHSLIPVRRAVGFQTKLASDSSTNAHLRLKLESGEISRSILVADSRGRMVLAEPCTLVFFSTIPTVNVRHVTRPLREPMTRQQMCILGLGLLKFNVIGMQLCPDNERHLVVWGLTEACVLIVKSDWTGIDDTINLVFDIGQRDSDDGNHLVKCEWIPGSESNVVVGCSRFVRIYDVARTKNGSRALPVVGYNLGFEANLRDVTMVASQYCAGIPSMSKMFLLLENGRLHVVELKSGDDGRLESPADQQRFEPSECVSLSMCGIRLRSGIGAPGSATRTLGEGSHLAYLKQSRTLLYKCSTSCVVALMFDKKGAVEGTFEFLPHVLSAGALGDISDNTSISGPYTHWTELGLTYRNGATFFRVSCIGRSVNSKAPKLICVEFNENESRVGLLSWSPLDDDDLDLMPSGSFAGLAAFSTPFISNNTATNGPMYGERAFLGAVSSDGTIFFFGEECIDSLPISEEVNPQNTIQMVDASGSAFEAQAKKKPAFPLTIFETLQNIGDSASVVFGGRGIGSGGDDLKARLSRDSGQSFVCPNRNGCTITVSLREKETRAASTNSALAQDKDSLSAGQLVIAAVRILVGSSFGGIPSRVVVQGRPLDLTPRAKKWYCLPLTKEEIALGVRSGFISVGIERPFDSSSSIVIDAMEVYGIDRESLEQWLPKSYSYTDLSTAPCHPVAMQEQEQGVNGHQSGESTSLIHCCQALSNLCEVSGGRKNILSDERDFLRELVEETAMDTCNRVRDSVQNLLKNLEPDSRLRTSFLDECILSGCARTVAMSKSAMEASAMESDDDLILEKSYQQKAIGSLIRNSLQAASRIANERPMNYLKTMENAIESDLSSASLAVEASKVLIAYFAEVEEYQEMITGSEGIMELSLIELAIELNTDSAHSEQFASFTTIRNFLDMGNADFVKRTCDAISIFCGKHGNTERNGLFTLIQHARLVAYQCDSCTLFPMKIIRYTLLEGDHDIDLCQECYSLGKKYAESNNFDPSVEVKVNGESVGAEPKLDCAQLKQMQPVSLERMDVELVEVSTNNPKEVKDSDDRMEEEKDQDENTKRPNSSEEDNGIGCQAFEEFLGFLFRNIVDHVASKLKKQDCGSEIAPIFGLLLELVQLSQQGDVQDNHAKRFAKELCIGLSYLLRTSANSESSEENTLPVILCLRALSSLLAPENYASDWSQPDDVLDSARLSKHKEKTNPNYVCPMHKIPAVRRRCNSGANKDRRFYVCGMERGQRCKYFVWADESVGRPQEQKRDRSPIYDIIRDHLWKESTDVGVSLQERLCQILEDVLFDGDDNDSATSGSGSKKKDRLRLGSTYSHENKQKDFTDGVFCSREKLRDIISVKTELDNSQNSFSSYLMAGKKSGDHNMGLLESSLDLLVLVADHKTQGISRWFSLLCEIIVSKTKHAATRPMAKKVLKNLCGGKMTLFQTIRDHFGFWFQLKRLYRCSITRLEAALIVKEKARYCHPDWSNLEKKTWANLCVGDLIGADELLSEDTYSHASCKTVGRVLDDLWNGIKSRDDSWRRFCGLRSLPQSLRDQRNKSNSDTYKTHNDQYLSEAAPIMALFWISCALSGTNQTKALRILDFALNNSSAGSRMNGKGSEAAIDNDDSSMKEEEDVISLSQEGRALPEEILMTGKEKLTVDGFVAFSMTYVYGGRASQLRQAAAGILKKLSNSLSTEDQGRLFQRLVYVPMEDAGRMGKASNEFLGFLQSLSSSIGSEIPRDAADLVLDCFEQQIEAARYDRSNGEWVVLESNAGGTPVKKRFDISPCLHCQRQHSPGKDSFGLLGERAESGSSSGRNNRGGLAAAMRRSGTSTAQSPSRTQDQRKWHKDQVAAFSRGRIDSSKESSASNEFCSFFLLKYRLSISEIHLSVNDPRGRYVKTINVYFSPRPVNAVSDLKAEEYDLRWKKCATMSLSRGALRASATLPEPIVASNLKFEYAEFYDRPGGSKAADGSFVVHCPRCTRVVTNAHGVCGNCGEVAFQCRKCRHINYDRLDAFLCVECGYCASGTFSYELSAGVASNAVTITSDEDRERAMKMLGTVISIENDIRSAIREKVTIIGRKKPNAKKDDLEQNFNSSMKMAFMGIPSSTTHDHSKVFDRVEKPGSVVKYVARPNSAPLANSRSPSTVDRTRSLLRLARQIRSESGYPSSGERRRSGDVIIRHLGRGLAIDHMEEDNDLLGLLEDDGLDSSDPMSRALLASSRRRGLGGPLASLDAAAGGSGGGDGETTRNESTAAAANASANTNTSASASSARKKELGKEAVMEFLKLHSLLREAEREKNELSRRLQAWDGLCRGYIGQVDTQATTNTELEFAPSHCSTCSVPVAQQLLTLWLRLFQASPSTVSVDLDFICTLLEEMPGIGKGFLESKRMVVREIATKSPFGAKLVLNELRKRLEVSRDMNCAEILGKILESNEFEFADEFTQLAMDVLAR
ncbi:unnamed protein product [Cylindrotheca closterium]|uniref:UBR-type domain-containing protein n=1 Tax=Cylindrotheca closterium TaxID=2856 RepID=A0AAD2CNG7_9STRA|nr:unnamed protein product [Cylindrotheca closterium]